MKNKTAAIIVAAGESTRMDGLSKQFIELCGKEVIVRTAEAFENAGVIDEIIIVCRQQDQAQMAALLSKAGIKKLKGFARGGAQRQQSVQNGLALVSGDVTHIAVHDGARPLVTEKLIEETAANAFRYGASAPGVPVKDTIKTVSGGFIGGTPDRSSLYAIQTPQIFEKILYLRALEAANTIVASYTDDCALVEAADARVYVTPGDYTNIKITTPDDIPAAQAIINSRLSARNPGGFND